jgi:hypothetical protein
MTVEEFREKLPPREFWYAHEVAAALGQTLSAVQKRAKRNSIGRIRKRAIGARGVRVFTELDLPLLLSRG